VTGPGAGLTAVPGVNGLSQNGVRGDLPRVAPGAGPGEGHGRGEGMAAGETEVPAADDGGAALVVRHRAHRFPGRRFEVKALFDDSEASAVRAAAALAGLTPSGYVAASAVTAARPASNAAVGNAAVGNAAASNAAVGSLVVGVDRAVLAELLAARTAVRRYAVNVNQAVVLLRTAGGGEPVWLRSATAGCDRAVQHLDEVTLRLAAHLALGR